MDNVKKEEPDTYHNVQAFADISERSHGGSAQAELGAQREEMDQMMDSDYDSYDENGEAEDQEQNHATGTSAPAADNQQEERRVYKENMRLAFQWMLENPDESPRVAGRIFKVNGRSLARTWNRHKDRQGKPPIPKGRPKSLHPRQEEALVKFCRDCYESGSGATRDIVLAAVAMIRSLEDPPRLPITKGWLYGWLKNSPLHVITTKPPMSRGRRQAVVMENVRRRLSNLPEIPKDSLLAPSRKAVPFKDQEYEIVVPRDIIPESTSSEQSQPEHLVATSNNFAQTENISANRPGMATQLPQGVNREGPTKGTLNLTQEHETSAGHVKVPSTTMNSPE